MLVLLHIENIAVIESADIRFDGGFNALTGETGAGKSIVVDAIGAILGQRTSRDLIRTGARSAQVSAIFVNLPPLAWFADNGVFPDENGELLLSREIQPDGRNVCRANGRLLTVAQMKELGEQLVNIHGQHDGQQLLDEGSHLTYLDRFGALERPLDDYRAAFSAVRGLQREIAALQMDESEKLRRIEQLTHQIGELERAALKPGEDESLTARRDILRNAGKLLGAVEAAHGALSGDEDGAGAVDLITQAEQALTKVASVSGEVSALAEKMMELRCAAADAAELTRDLRGAFDVSPGELDEVEGRLDILYRLKKKYGGTVEEMLNYLAASQTELDEIACGADTIARLEKKLEAARREAEEKARFLSEKRHTAAELLQARIANDLAELDMPGVRFAVDFRRDDVPVLDANGMDTVQFLMSANVGEALKPIQKIASGGELARIMLAMKNVLAENDDIATLIFDEVDAGVSGRAAQRVAEKLACVARYKQVLCVTHLPQLAAMADTHFVVEKRARDGHTYTEVERLDAARRREELARLTGGANITPAMLESAGQLLDAASQYKIGARGG